MATTNSPKLTYALSYGFGEGPLHGRKLRRLLEAAGFELVHDLASADIILAHSAGCWMLPDSAHPKLIVYVGMPLPITNAQKVWLKANLLGTKEAMERGNIYYLAKHVVLDIFYMIRHLSRSWQIVRGSTKRLPKEFPHALSVFVANRHDPWPFSSRLDDYLHSKHWAFISQPGSHSHVWTHPDYYVELINHYAELLAKTGK